MKIIYGLYMHLALIKGCSIGGKQVKMSISKVLSFEAYRDGIMLVKDGATPKPYTFVGFDPWFVINAMQLVVD